MMKRGLLSFLLCLALCLLGDAPGGWKLRRPAAADGQTALTDLQVRDDSLILPVDLPQSLEYVVSAPQATLKLEEAEALLLRFIHPAGLPANTTVTVFSKDNDHLWRQIRTPFAMLETDEDGITTLNIPLRGREAVQQWQPCGHNRPWTPLTLAALVELGFRFEFDQNVSGVCQGEAELLEATAVPISFPSLAGIRDFGIDTLKPQVGGRLEVTFRLDGWVTCPYDSERFSILADVTLPGDKPATETVRGYYYENFLYDAADNEKVRCLTPDGEPCYKIRYCPRQPGRHTMAITVSLNGHSITVPPFSFEAQPAPKDYHGFVRVDTEHDQYFKCDDGTVFTGIGMNVRSPFDDRYFHVAPYSLWQNQGLQAYDALFRRYRDLGINVAEVWMCSWWLALEWMNDSPGFHGVGHYNQYRAWMLDHILSLAEQNGIRLILVLNNHGKFGMTYDTEWARNPYNKALGGYLEKCEHYFADARAKADFKKTADYIVARWGASPNILAWKLFTEVDLTGQNIQAYLSDPNIAAWHAEMGAYLKKIDVYKHPATTHWMLSYQRIDEPTANVRELDFLSTDAYYSLGGGSALMMSLMTGASTFGKNHHKPLVITEFGGSSYADSMRNMMNQVEIGLWTGFFYEMGILPMYWWFGLVEDKNLHSRYQAIHQYSQGIDRRGMTAAARGIQKSSLQVHELRSKDQLLFWLMDPDYYFSSAENAQPAEQHDLTLEVPALETAGNYRVEFWDVLNGGQAAPPQQLALQPNQPVRIALPKFRKTIALKILKQ